MANMSYCRFENTLNDLSDCFAATEEAETFEDLDLSSYESAAFDSMVNLMEEMLREMRRLQESQS